MAFQKHCVLALEIPLGVDVAHVVPSGTVERLAIAETTNATLSRFLCKLLSIGCVELSSHFSTRDDLASMP